VFGRKTLTIWPRQTWLNPHYGWRNTGRIRHASPRASLLRRALWILRFRRLGVTRPIGGFTNTRAMLSSLI